MRVNCGLLEPLTLSVPGVFAFCSVAYPVRYCRLLNNILYVSSIHASLLTIRFNWRSIGSAIEASADNCSRTVSREGNLWLRQIINFGYKFPVRSVSACLPDGQPCANAGGVLVILPRPLWQPQRNYNER